MEQGRILAYSKDQSETSVHTLQILDFISKSNFRPGEKYKFTLTSVYKTGIGPNNQVGFLVNSLSDGKLDIRRQKAPNVPFEPTDWTDPNQIAMYAKDNNLLFVNSYFNISSGTERNFTSRLPNFVSALGFPNPDRYQIDFWYRGQSTSPLIDDSLKESVHFMSGNSSFTLSHSKDKYILTSLNRDTDISEGEYKTILSTLPQ
jgi:hypothetical protein